LCRTDAPRHQLIGEAVAPAEPVGFQGGASLRCIAQRDEQLFGLPPASGARFGTAR
jgi:hypothetical protein